MRSASSILDSDANLDYRILQTSITGRKVGPFAAVNQDRMLHRVVHAPGGDLILIAVADGVSCCPHGGEVADYLIARHLANDPIFQGTNPAGSQLADYLSALHARFYEEFAESPDMQISACTLSIAVIHGRKADCFWVGDSPIFHLQRRGTDLEVTQLSSADLHGRLLTDCFGAHAAFELKQRNVEMRPGSAIAVATDGAVREAGLLTHLVQAHGLSNGLLRAIEARARRKAFYDDATIVIAHAAEKAVARKSSVHIQE